MPASLARAPEFEAVYRAHHGFVWRALQHLGVDAARVDDAAQDVFLVVHRRLPQFVMRAPIRTWLFEIARRVASRYRRKAAGERRHEPLVEAEVTAPTSSTLEHAEAVAIVARLLAGLAPEQAVVFVLAELEQWRAPEIAEELGVNVNTVYTRLRAARRELDRLLRRLDARDRRVRGGAAALVCLALARQHVPPPPVALRQPTGVEGVLFKKTWSPRALVESTVASSGSGGLAVAGASLVVLLTFGAGARAPTKPVRETMPVGGESAPREAAAREVAPGPEPAVVVAEPAKPRRTAGEDALTAELALVESLRAAVLAQDDRAVLARVARYQRRFRDGVFAPEVAAAAIEARCRLGEHARARGEVEAFLARWPTSNLAERVGSLCRKSGGGERDR